ncbi:hypothetical protein EV424DRAFT_1344380 [Suillus variegatus]|nr:hypothetical protein EV424DRAFT_1344380 [Suillus variegatus]
MTSARRSAHQRKVAIASADADAGMPAVPSEDEIEEARSPLYISLLGSALSRGAFTADACSEENIPVQNNPRPLRRLMGDKAEYWVNGSGDLLHMKFVARLDFHGQYSRLGPYFNLFDSGIDVASLKKTRAQYELHFLAPEDEDSGDYPQEALEMSCRVLDTLSALTTDIEDTRNAGIPEAEHPAMSGFVRAYTRDSKDCFVLVVQSEPLFKDLPKEGSAIPRISRKDIGKSGVLLSPKFLRICDLHDPDNRYSGLGSLKEAKVECPEVRDDKGLLIHPREYGIKLARARFVEVEVYLKLWNISKSDKDEATARERYGSRNYQLILRRMQLLPSMEYMMLQMLAKGKRKASEDLGSPSPVKRPSAVPNEDKEMEDL